MTNSWNNPLEKLGSAWNRYWFIPGGDQACGLLRLLTGVAALLWYLSYASQLQLWFGPDGLISSAAVAEYRSGRPAICLWDWVGNIYGLWLLYGIGLIAIVEMAVGYKARYTTPIATLFVLSLLHRGPILAGAGEDWLAMLMVYLSLADSGRYWSLDAWLMKSSAGGWQRFRGNTSATRRSRIALRLIQIHGSLLLVGMLAGQLNDPGWWNGTALWGWVTRADSRWIDLTGWFGNHLVLSGMTFAVLIWEAASIFCRGPVLRPWLIAVAVPLWGVIAVTGGTWLLPWLLTIWGIAFCEFDDCPTATK